MTITMARDLDSYLPSVADFPRPGVVFRDICPLLADPAAFAAAIAGMCGLVRGWSHTHIAGIESRGLIFATAMAQQLALPLLPVRKPGKLPPPIERASYALEYGSDALEMQRGSVHAGDSVLLVDDVIATGGTLLAAAAILRRLGAVPVGAVALLDIGALGGIARLQAGGLRASCLLHG